MCVVKDPDCSSYLEETSYSILTNIFGFTPCYDPSCRCHWYEDPIYGGKDISKEMNLDKVPDKKL
jgi:hypothetical protein